MICKKPYRNISIYKKPLAYKTLRKIKEYTPEYGIHNSILTLQQPDAQGRGCILKEILE